nr:MAG TPA: hypothetical protein [Caudoviricetes sp.]
MNKRIRSMMKSTKLYSDKHESSSAKFRIADYVKKNKLKTNIRRIIVLNRLSDICRDLGPAMWPIEDPITHEIDF